MACGPDLMHGPRDFATSNSQPVFRRWRSRAERTRRLRCRRFGREHGVIGNRIAGYADARKPDISEHVLKLLEVVP